MKNKSGIIYMFIGAAMVIGALILLIYNGLEDSAAGKQSQEVLESVQEKISDTVKERIKDGTIAEKALEEALKDSSSDMTVVEIDGYGYIGYLTIPALSVELPVMSEIDYSRLHIAPCRYSGSTKTDDLVIAAHNYKRHFGYIGSLKAGDKVYFTDMVGNVTVYTVMVVEVLNPEQVKEMVESDWELTLYTCNYSGAQRITVRCSKDS